MGSELPLMCSLACLCSHLHASAPFSASRRFDGRLKLLERLRLGRAPIEHPGSALGRLLGGLLAAALRRLDRLEELQHQLAIGRAALDAGLISFSMKSLYCVARIGTPFFSTSTVLQERVKEMLVGCRERLLRPPVRVGALAFPKGRPRGFFFGFKSDT